MRPRSGSTNSATPVCSYHGLATLGGGATLAGIILGAVTVFIIERQLEKAAWFAAAGAVLTFFGFIHGEEIGFAQSPVVAFGYLGVAVMLFGFARFAAGVARRTERSARSWRDDGATGGIARFCGAKSLLRRSSPRRETALGVLSERDQAPSPFLWSEGAPGCRRLACEPG